MIKYCTNMSLLDVYPIREPMVVAEYMNPIALGKIFVEIDNPKSGDIAKCISKSARHTYVIENDKKNCLSLTSRNIDVICNQLNRFTYNTTLIKADVYYWWSQPGMNLPYIRWIRDFLYERQLEADVYFAFDSHMTEDVLQIAKQLKFLKYKFGNRSTIKRLLFDEQEGEGLFPNNSSIPGDAASYSTPFFNRHGKWGVFHIMHAHINGKDESSKRWHWP